MDRRGKICSEMLLVNMIDYTKPDVLWKFRAPSEHVLMQEPNWITDKVTTPLLCSENVI